MALLTKQFSRTKVPLAGPLAPILTAERTALLQQLALTIGGIMVITILLIIINHFMTELYFVHQMTSQYHHYWYAILVINTPITDFTLRQRFIRDNILLIIRRVFSAENLCVFIF